MSGSAKTTGTGTGADDATVLARLPDIPSGVGDNAPYLRIIHPSDNGGRFALSEHGLVLGRAEEAEVTLSDPTISRRHCRVARTPQGIVVEDLGSTNGTAIDGQRVERAYLDPKSRLKVGPFVLKVEYKGAVELEAEAQLLEAARTDELTGIPNRRRLTEEAATLLASLTMADQYLSVVMIDIDRFKSINDRHGHGAGDEVLRTVAQVLEDHKRKRDLLGRYGGEEFLMVLPDTDGNDALIYCDRLRESVAETFIPYQGTVITVKVSMGIASCRRGEVHTLEALIGAADTAMYRAKRAGRNRVCT